MLVKCYTVLGNTFVKKFYPHNIHLYSIYFKHTQDFKSCYSLIVTNSDKLQVKVTIIILIERAKQMIALGRFGHRC